MTRARKLQDGLLKISDLARETGVPTGTIKFYMRAGLLPPPTLKTGRNMAYYDRGFVDRIKAIKELKQKRFLPLEIIKAILDRDAEVISPREIDTLMRLEGRLYEEVHYALGRDPIAIEEVESRYGINPQLLSYLIEVGILTPVARDGSTRFEGEDVAILETLAEMKKAGFDDELIPKEICVPLYVDAIGSLAREELRIFSRAVTEKVEEERLPELAMAGIKLVEQFIVLLRRKLLLQALHALRQEAVSEQTGTNEGEAVGGLRR
jgi:DNA-binding transcriptional MerR regulator